MNTTSKQSRKSLWTKILVVLMAAGVLLSAFSPMKASAHTAYMLSISVNQADSRYEPIILVDRAGWANNWGSHREPKIAKFGRYNYTKTTLPGMEDSYPGTVEAALEDYKDSKYVTTTYMSPPHLPFSFPGYHGDGDYDATAKDMAQAQWVADTMVQSLNDAVAFISQKAGKQPDKYELMFLGTKLANGVYTEQEFTYQDLDIKVVPKAKAPKEEKVKNVNNDGYVRVEVADENVTEKRLFVGKVPKGYKKNQVLFDSMPYELQQLDEKNTGEKDKKGFSQDVTSLTWRHAVLQAHYAYWHEGISYDEFDTIVKPSRAEQYMTDMGESFMLMLRSMLGLYSFTELMLNEGERGGGGYFLGIMPNAWLDSASILHWTSMALSWLLIMFAFAKLLALRNLAAINVAKRVDLVDGIKNLIIVGFALMLFNPIFYALANFNWLLVDVMKNTSNFTSAFGTSAPGTGTLAKLIINLAYLVIEIYFNFIYISRGIIVAILYGLGPLFVASIAFGGRFAQIFSNYIRELVGTIYVQTFHAVLVAFFATVTVFGGVRLFEQLVVLFAFIPLTKFFREALGVGGGIADMAGAGAFGAVSDMTKMGTRSMRSKGGSGLTKAQGQKANTATGIAPNTQIKNSSNFQNGGAGGAGGSGGSMTDVEKPTHQIAKGGDIVDSNGVKSSPKGSYALSSDSKETLKEAGMGLAKVGGGASLMGAGIGMAATGHGSLAQNMREVAPKGGGKSNGKPGQGSQKAGGGSSSDGGAVSNQSGYDSSEVSADQSTVTHKVHKQDENGADGMYDDYGVTDAREENGSLVYEYDYDADRATFRAGSHNHPQQAEKMQDMYQAFNDPKQADKKAGYQAQGIQGVKQNANGRVEVQASKGTAGLKGIGQENGMYQFRRRNGDNSNLNMMDAIEQVQPSTSTPPPAPESSAQKPPAPTQPETPAPSQPDPQPEPPANSSPSSNPGTAPTRRIGNTSRLG